MLNGLEIFLLIVILVLAVTLIVTILGARKKAKDSSEAIAQSAPLVAHQLLSPLSIIRWSTELLNKKENLTPDEKELITNIHENDLDLIKTINDVATVADIHKKPLIEKSSKTDIIALIHDIVKEHEVIAETKKLHISFNNQTKNDLLEIPYNKERLKRVVSGLLENAIFYNEKPGDIILALSSDNKFLTLSVQDTGIGIPEKDKPNITNKFFRGSNAGTFKQHSLGLTLYMIKELLKIAGGKLWFDSQEKTGSTFSVKLPL